MKISSILIFGLLFLMACSSAEKTTVTLGYITPLTGEVANYGESSRGGAEIALAEINAAGGIDGMPLQLIFEDGECKAQSATTAAQKLINVDQVKIITGTVCSAETLAVAPLAEENNIVLVSVASSNPSITQSGDYIFRVWPSDAGQGKKMAEYALAQGYKNVAVMNQLSDYNVALAETFITNFEAGGGTITNQEAYPAETKDFRAQITKIKGKQPDAVYFVPYAEGGLVAKQLRELGITVPLLSAETFATPEILKDAGNAAEGVVYATPAYDDKSEKAQAVMKKYIELYGKEPSFGVITMHAYDAVHLLAGIMQDCGTDATCVKDALYNVKDYDGAAGRLTIDSNGDALKDFQLMVVNDGQFVKL
ncbi:MAG TPA: ABC transporter substrate-binding protein [Candidatus Nanoarchaeia archaeon]|nr:ABC transporter substrate-binding protein [Candidatus Nanoarchaeia archaeon]